MRQPRLMEPINTADRVQLPPLLRITHCQREREKERERKTGSEEEIGRGIQMVNPNISEQFHAVYFLKMGIIQTPRRLFFLFPWYRVITCARLQRFMA